MQTYQHSNKLRACSVYNRGSLWDGLLYDVLAVICSTNKFPGRLLFQSQGNFRLCKYVRHEFILEQDLLDLGIRFLGQINKALSGLNEGTEVVRLVIRNDDA